MTTPREECIHHTTLYIGSVLQSQNWKLHPVWPSEMRIIQLLHLRVNVQGIQTALMSNWLMFQLIYCMCRALQRTIATIVEVNAVSLLKQRRWDGSQLGVDGCAAHVKVLVV